MKFFSLQNVNEFPLYRYFIYVCYFVFLWDCLVIYIYDIAKNWRCVNLSVVSPSYNIISVSSSVGSQE